MSKGHERVNNQEHIEEKINGISKKILREIIQSRIGCPDVHAGIDVAYPYVDEERATHLREISSAIEKLVRTLTPEERLQLVSPLTESEQKEIKWAKKRELERTTRRWRYLDEEYRKHPSHKPLI